MTSSPGIGRRFLARESSEDRTDGQPETSKITLRKNIPGHDFSCRENILERASAFMKNMGAFVHRDAHVRKCDPRPQRQAVKRRPIDGHGPIAFWRREAPRANAIQALHASLRVSCRGAIKFRDRVYEDPG